MKCKKCNALLLGDICSDCGTSNKRVIEFGEHNPYASEPCALCGQRGRRIDGERKSTVICFDCHVKEDQWRVNHLAYRDWSTDEVYKIDILIEDVLKPQFYGEAPSYERYQDLIPSFMQPIEESVSGGENVEEMLDEV